MYRTDMIQLIRPDCKDHSGSWVVTDDGKNNGQETDWEASGLNMGAIPKFGAERKRRIKGRQLPRGAGLEEEAQGLR